MCELRFTGKSELTSNLINVAVNVSGEGCVVNKSRKISWESYVGAQCNVPVLFFCFC